MLGPFSNGPWFPLLLILSRPNNRWCWQPFSGVSVGSEHGWNSGPTCRCPSPTQHPGSCSLCLPAALHSPGPPGQEAPRPTLNTLTHGGFPLVPRDNVDCPPFPAQGLCTCRLVCLEYSSSSPEQSAPRRRPKIQETVSLPALATTPKYFISYLYDHLTVFPTKLRALDCLIYCFVFKVPATLLELSKYLVNGKNPQNKTVFGEGADTICWKDRLLK